MAQRDHEKPPVIPGYTFQRTLGGGGFADVSLYEQDMPRRQVAVKVLSRSLSPEFVTAMFNSEGDIMARLSGHPSILTVFETNQAPDGRYYLSMEYCPSGYGRRYKNDVIGVPEVLNTAVKIANAVEIAHRAGIIHRDIKPSNILVTKFQTPVLSDFGISLSVHSASAGLDAMSIPWSAPEIITGKDRGSVATDVWSFGATIYSLLAGQSPFDVAGRKLTNDEIKARIVKSRLAPIGRLDVPTQLQQILAKCMSKDPNARFSSALQVAQELQQLEVNLGLPATAIDIVDAAWLQTAPVAAGSESVFRGQNRAMVPVQSQRQRQFVKPKEFSLDGGVEYATILNSARPQKRRGWIWVTVCTVAAAGVVIGALALLGVFQ